MMKEPEAWRIEVRRYLPPLPFVRSPTPPAKKTRIAEILHCGQCDATKPRDEFVGTNDKNLIWESRGSKTYNTYRCRTCVFPACASCHAEAKKNISLDEFTKQNSQLSWYCDECQQCTFCGEWQKKTLNFTEVGTRTYSDICIWCEHPRCRSCGDKHVGKQALRRDNPGIRGAQFSRVWYCRKPACQKICKEL